MAGPYTPRGYGSIPFQYGSRPGYNIFSSLQTPAAQAENQIDQEILPILRNNYNRAIMGQYLDAYPALKPTSPTAASSPFQPYVPTATGGPARNSNNPLFDLVKVGKDPTGRYDRINSWFLDDITGTKPNYSSYRSLLPEIIGSQANSAADQAANRSDTQAFIDKYLGSQPKLDTQTEVQSTALQRYFAGPGEAGSFVDQLAAERANQSRAEQSVANRAAEGNALSILLRQQKEGSIADIAPTLASLNSQIAERAAIRDSERASADTRYIEGLRQANAGRPQELITTNVLRGQIPIQARAQMLDSEARQAAQRLANIGQAVTIDTMTDELSVAGRQLGLTGQALQQYLAQNFYGINKQGADYPLYIDQGFNNNRATYQPPQGGYIGGGSGGYDGGYSEGPTARSVGVTAQEREEYGRIAGVDPYRDPNFSLELIQNIRSSGGQSIGQYDTGYAIGSAIGSGSYRDLLPF